MRAEVVLLLACLVSMVRADHIMWTKYNDSTCTHEVPVGYYPYQVSDVCLGWHFYNEPKTSSMAQCSKTGDVVTFSGYGIDDHCFTETSQRTVPTNVCVADDYYFDQFFVYKCYADSIPLLPPNTPILVQKIYPGKSCSGYPSEINKYTTYLCNSFSRDHYSGTRYCNPEDDTVTITTCSDETCSSGCRNVTERLNTCVTVDQSYMDEISFVSHTYSCEYPITPSPSPSPSPSPTPSPAPSCNDSNGSKCDTGYACANTTGSYKCEDINECLTSPCTEYANCTNSLGGYSCDALPFYITSAMTGGLVFGPAGDSTAAGTLLVMQTKVSGKASQMWRYTAGMFIENVESGLVLDVFGGKVFPGQSVVLWTRKLNQGAGNQRWKYDPVAKTFASQAGVDVVLDVFGADPSVGTKLCVYTPQRAKNQQFTFEKAF